MAAQSSIFGSTGDKREFASWMRTMELKMPTLSQMSKAEQKKGQQTFLMRHLRMWQQDKAVEYLDAAYGLARELMCECRQEVTYDMFMVIVMETSGGKYDDETFGQRSTFVRFRMMECLDKSLDMWTRSTVSPDNLWGYETLLTSLRHLVVKDEVFDSMYGEFTMKDEDDMPNLELLDIFGVE